MTIGKSEKPLTASQIRRLLLPKPVVFHESGEIVFEHRRQRFYSISTDRCRTKDQILRWVYHLCEKNWVRRRHIEQFIGVACDIHGLSPWGTLTEEGTSESP